MSSIFWRELLRLCGKRSLKLTGVSGEAGYVAPFAAKKRVTVVFKVLIAQGKIWGTTTFPDFSFLSRKKNVSRDVFYLST